MIDTTSDRFRRCVATVSLGGTLRDKLEAAALAGFDGIEIMQDDLAASRQPPRSIRAIAEGVGLAIEVYQPLRDVEGVGTATHRRNRSRVERALDTAAELGARTVLVCSNTSSDAIDDDERSAEQLGELADWAAERFLTLGFEALSWGTYVKTFDRAWTIVAAAARPNLGVVVDSFHSCALKDDLSRLERVRGNRIALVQLSDAPQMTCDLVRWSRHFRCLPGEGAFDVAAVLQRVLATGYRGPVSLEIYNDRVGIADARKTAQLAMRSLRALERAARQSRTSTTPDARPARTTPRTQLMHLADNVEFDVAVIGGGPAGAAMASYCAKAGATCCVLERDAFPRFHIGESFVPSSTRIFKEIGFLHKMEEAGFLHKRGAGWTGTNDPRVFEINFDEREQEGVDLKYTYHVSREKFDTLLLRHAASLGATVFEGAAVSRVDLAPGENPRTHFTLGGAPLSVTSKIVVDASGRRTLLGNQLRLKIMDPIFDQYAIHGWFDGFDRKTWGEHTLIHFLPVSGGWMWQIPISETVTSVGVVSQKQHFRAAKQSREEFFWDCIRRRPELYDALRQSTQVHPLREDGDYSYAMKQIAGDRWLLIGDAARFVDPIFSSGVSIALTAARFASQDVIAALQKGEFSTDSFRTYVDTIRNGTRNWYEFIRLYYRLNVLFTAFIIDPEYRYDVLQLLQGDLYDAIEPAVLGKMRQVIEKVERNPRHVWHQHLSDLTAANFKPVF